MTILGLGLALLLGMLLVHVVRWRLALPKNQLATLLKLILGLGGLWFAANLGLGLAGLGLGPLPLSPLGCLHVFLFYLSLSFGYVFLFSTIDADSPSINILLALHAAGAQGLSEAELTKRVGMDRFFASRIDRMADDRMVLRSANGVTPGSKGLALLQLVVFWRVIMGAPRELG